MGAVQLASRGYSLDDALAAAERKDAGGTRESIATVLSDVDWPSLRALGEREGLEGWSEIERLFRAFTERAAMGLLPDQADVDHA